MSGSKEVPPPPPPSTPQTQPQQVPHTMSTVKLPLLKKGEYDIWAMKMEHYLAHTDYPIWEVIQKERERERKARTTLLMTIPEDHLAKFHRMTDAKDIWDAIKTRFGRNDESKKMQNGVSSSSKNNSNRETSSSYTDDLLYSFFANQSNGPQLDHEDLEQINEFDLEEMDLKWQVAMISMRLKKFYNKTGRKLHFDEKELVGFDKTKDARRKDAGSFGYKVKDNVRRSGKKEESSALVTLGGQGIDWTAHADDEDGDFALMAFNNDTELLEEALKEKEDLKAKVEKWHHSLKNLSKLLDTQMSANDMFGLGYGDYRFDGVLSYENEVLL
ncbi:hypothetical protein Tco_0872428 [Tanacetum coccineum]